MQTEITILYIEDNEANRELVRFILARKQQWKMLEAETGAAGIETAHAELPDVILLDISLPDINGLEVFRRLKADGRTASIPIIAMSGNSSAGDIAAGLKLGFAAYLAKPIEIEPLYDAIERSLC